MLFNDPVSGQVFERNIVPRPHQQPLHNEPERKHVAQRVRLLCIGHRLLWAHPVVRALHAGTARAESRQLCSAKVDQLHNAVLVHYVLGFEVAVGVRFALRGLFFALGRVHVDKGTANADYDVKLVAIVEIELLIAIECDLQGITKELRECQFKLGKSVTSARDFSSRSMTIQQNG